MYDRARRHGTDADTATTAARAPGKRTLTGQLAPRVSAAAGAALGHDFTSVTVHEDGQADALGTRAFAHGEELHFAAGAYQPDSPAGLSLIGHELSHVAQQREGRVTPTGVIGGMAVNTDPALEAEADAGGARVAQGFDLDTFLDFGLPSPRATTTPVRQGDDLPATSPLPSASHVVADSETPRMIASAHGVAVEALLDANRDKVKTWTIDGKTHTGFNAGDTVIIPATGATLVAPVPSASAGATTSAGDTESPTWSEWAITTAKTAADTAARAAGGVLDLLTDAVTGLFGSILELVPGTTTPTGPADGTVPSGPANPTPSPNATEHGATVLTEERLSYWVELAARVYTEKKAADSMSKPHAVAEIDGWLVELAIDQAATTDPVQLRVLAAVQFQLETTKRGTDYDLGSERDFDLDQSFDCSEAVQWMMIRSGLGEIFGETTPKTATTYMFGIISDVFGSALRDAPRTGDIMMWGGHTGIVAAVRPEDGLFYVSHIGGAGSYFTPFDLAEPTKVDPARGINVGASAWSGGVKGYWAPEDAALPAPIGRATTVVGKGSAPKKFFKASTDAYAEGAFDVGLTVELIKHVGDMWLVRPVGSQGAAWVRSQNLQMSDPNEGGE